MPFNSGKDDQYPPFEYLCGLTAELSGSEQALSETKGASNGSDCSEWLDLFTFERAAFGSRRETRPRTRLLCLPRAFLLRGS
jgi:hypothetical protein